MLFLTVIVYCVLLLLLSLVPLAFDDEEVPEMADGEWYEMALQDCDSMVMGASMPAGAFAPMQAFLDDADDVLSCMAPLMDDCVDTELLGSGLFRASARPLHRGPEAGRPPRPDADAVLETNFLLRTPELW